MKRHGGAPSFVGAARGPPAAGRPVTQCRCPRAFCAGRVGSQACALLAVRGPASARARRRAVPSLRRDPLSPAWRRPAGARVQWLPPRAAHTRTRQTGLQAAGCTAHVITVRLATATSRSQGRAPRWGGAEPWCGASMGLGASRSHCADHRRQRCRERGVTCADHKLLPPRDQHLLLLPHAARPPCSGCRAAGAHARALARAVQPRQDRRRRGAKGLASALWREVWQRVDRPVDGLQHV